MIENLFLLFQSLTWPAVDWSLLVYCLPVFGLFGGRSKSKSTTISNVSTQNVGFSEIDGNAVSVLGSNNTVTDLGAIEAAFDFANAQSAAQTSLVEGFGTFAQQTQQGVQQFAQKTQEGVQQLARKVNEGDAARMAELLKWGVAALAVAWVASAFTKRGKR